ncbi:MAG: hypothetical protein WC339_07095, partial [Candidatus Izemoplasmatales bacterium]
HDIQQSINQKSGYLSKAIPNRYLQALSTLILNTALCLKNRYNPFKDVYQSFIILSYNEYYPDFK